MVNSTIFKTYEGLVATLVRVTPEGNDIPVVAHDGSWNKQHIAGFAIKSGYTDSEKESIISFAERLKNAESRWIAIYTASSDTVLLDKGTKSVVHGFKSIKAGDYRVVTWEDFIEIIKLV